MTKWGLAVDTVASQRFLVGHGCEAREVYSPSAGDASCSWPLGFMSNVEEPVQLLQYLTRGPR